MKPPTMLMWSDEFLKYSFGPTHPMSPLRLSLTRDLVEAFGLLNSVELATSEAADHSLLELVHAPEYVQAVENNAAECEQLGFADDDTPLSAQTHHASSHIAGASVAGALAVWQGRTSRAVNFAGGMHHAMRAKAAGFCVYNDPAIAIAALLEQGAKRVAYLDIDAHHGDGVERAFWDDPRVLTISIHQHGDTLFPGTGFPQDMGGPAAFGLAANVALAPGTSDGAWLRSLDAVARPLLAQFNPQMIISQHGCDAHGSDPLTGLDVSVDAQRIAALLIRDWAKEYCENRWLALGGGGYSIHSTVPRVWTHLVGIAADQDVDPGRELPAQWQDHVAQFIDDEIPHNMTDGREAVFNSWETGYDPSSEVDRAILATRRCVFPEHGLDPYLD